MPENPYLPPASTLVEESQTPPRKWWVAVVATALPASVAIGIGVLAPLFRPMFDFYRVPLPPISDVLFENYSSWGCVSVAVPALWLVLRRHPRGHVLVLMFGTFLALALAGLFAAGCLVPLFSAAAN